MTMRAAPALLCLCCLVGCAKAPPPSQDSFANFQVQPSPIGNGVVWSLQFKSLQQYHNFIDGTPNGTERAKVRELIADGLRLHHLACSATEKVVEKRGGGIAFVGSCSS